MHKPNDNIKIHQKRKYLLTTLPTFVCFSSERFSFSSRFIFIILEGLLRLTEQWRQCGCYRLLITSAIIIEATTEQPLTTAETTEIL